MKSKSHHSPLLPLVALVLLAFATCGYSQDDASSAPAAQPIHVTEVLHPDGSRTVMTTDPDNHSATSETYNQANKLLEKLVYTLDDQGVTTGSIAYSPKGKALYKLAYKHNGTGQVTEVDTYTMADVLVSRTIYRYATGGKVVGIDTYDPNGNHVSSSAVAPAENANASTGGGTPSGRRGYNPTDH